MRTRKGLANMDGEKRNGMSTHGTEGVEPLSTASMGPTPAESDREPPASPPDAHPLPGRTAVLPHLPGVYIFKDATGTILYVGKAIDIRKRVASYFRATGTLGIKTRMLVSKAADLEYMVTATEKEALLLESSLIKKHRPRYNVILRDDKNYPALRIDPRDPYPRLDIVRRFERDGALYFGPYPSGFSLREVLKLLNQLFPLRLCKAKKLMLRERPCLNYSLGRCMGACAGKTTPEEYHKRVEEIVLFLQGKADDLQRRMRARMEDAAAALEFERAASYRDRLLGIAGMLEKQHVVSDRFLDQDVLGIHREPDGDEIAVLFVRQGMISGQKSYNLKDAQGESEELIEAFIQQYYAEDRLIPDEILVPFALPAEAVLQEWLSDLKGRRVRIWAAKRGDRRELLDMAEKNARERFASRKRWQARDLSLLESLQKILHLPRTPVRMACVDISNIQGMHAVGSLVVFSDGRPDKSLYRHFRIEGKSTPDDPAMMTEVIDRLLRNEPEFAASLDLLVLDGGKGQLSAISNLFAERGVTGLPLISIAKEQEADRGEKGRGLYEKIYIPGRKNPLFLSHYPDILHLLQRLRDEAHRFAISRYHNLHRKELIASALDAIPGIGPKRRQALVAHFGSIETLQNATAEAIAEVPGISGVMAREIRQALDSRTSGDRKSRHFSSPAPPPSEEEIDPVDLQEDDTTSA